MSRAVIARASHPLRGILRLPGDKSISHRRALLSLFVNDDVRLSNYGTGADCRTTFECLQRLGKQIKTSGTEVHISGLAGCKPVTLDCGNSGTTARLLMGILAGHEGEWTLFGDDSLSRRPMERVATPLRKMGARIELAEGHLPAHIVGSPLTGMDYEAPVASAQVKSAVLLAGLKARGVTRYREPVITRDHTERLLGIHLDYVDWITVDPEKVSLTGDGLSGQIPSDPSTASFWLAVALAVPGSQIELSNLLANPLRIAHIRLLEKHEAQISARDQQIEGGEETAKFTVNSSSVNPFSVWQPETAQLIDEIPALAVLATLIDGRCEFHDAGELRVKESDRLNLITQNLRKMGAHVEQWEDGFAIEGSASLNGAEIETTGDHRIAMAFAMAGLVANGETIIGDAECVAVSYPEFWDDLKRLVSDSVTIV